MEPEEKENQKGTEELPKEQEVQGSVKETQDEIKEEVQKEEIERENKAEKLFEPAIEETKTAKKKKTVIGIVITFVIVLLLALLSVIFAILNMGNNKILSNIEINGVDVSGLSKQEAISKLQELSEKMIDTDITFSQKEFQTTISPKQLEVTYKIEDAVQRAYSVGREKGIIQNNYQIVKTKLFGSHINMEVEYNDEELLTQIDDINSKLPNGIRQSSYYIEGDQLIITKGTEGLAVKTEEMKQIIIRKLRDMKVTTENIGIPTEHQSPKAIDVEKIHSEIYREAKDAYYTTNPFKLYPHVDGVDFAISIEEAKSIVLEDKEEYTISLKVTKPNVTTNKLGNEAFPDLLGTFSTKYDASNLPRSKNLSLAAGKINGTVVMPGEIFSYNKVVGERTIAAGYQEAKVYENGKVVDGLGGGICQISSTLYNAVVFANLDIVSRRNHQFLTSYVREGRDATVVYGSTDFKFKNTRNYPIKLVCSVKNGIAKISVYGIKEEVEYQVEIRTNVVSTIPYTTKYTEDPTMEEGKEVVKQKGMNGCKSEAYKVLILNGQVISKTLLSKDTYNPMQRLVVKGTKKAIVTPEPAPTPKPEVKPDPKPDTKPETKPEPTPTPEQKPDKVEEYPNGIVKE